MNIRELASFSLADAVKFHTELNAKIFDADEHMLPRVRARLLEIAEDFIDHLGIKNLDVEDITLSGSNAAYSYTPHSDIDLHVLVDMTKINNDSIYRELFDAKKYQYNDQHDITIGGYDVELYVQDSNQPHVSLGEYSVLTDRWIRRPVRRRSNFDEAATRLKFDKLAAVVELALKSQDIDAVNEVIDTIRKYRRAGLSETGEFGPENLAFKALRTQGMIERLYKLRARLEDRALSLDEQRELISENKVSSNLSQPFKFKKSQANQFELITQLEGYFKATNESGKYFPHRAFILADHLVNYDNLILESTETNSLVDFQRQVKKFDQRSRVDLTPGKKVSILQIFPYTSDNLIELRGFTEPKKIKQVVTEHDGDIKWLEFQDGSTYPDQFFMNKGQGGGEWDGFNTMFFPDKPLAEQAITAITLISPTGYKISRKNVVTEASGYIPSERQKNDARFKTALTQDVRPSSIRDNAQRLGLGRIARTGRPPIARTNGRT